MIRGAYESTTAVTGVRFIMDSGNIASGTIRVYGLRNTAASALLTTKGDLHGYSTVDARVPVGGNSTFLMASSIDSLGVAWGTPSGGSGALVFLEAHTASSSATLDFTTFISSTYDEYVFEMVNVIPATNDQALLMRMGTGGGPTWDSGANYGWVVRIARGGGTANNGAESGQTFISLVYQSGGSLGVDSTTTSGGVSGSVRLFNPQSTSIYKQTQGTWRYRDAEPFILSAHGTGVYLSTTAVTGIRFLYASGNIASGDIRVYGISKS
jgi:hypothetical protein